MMQTISWKVTKQESAIINDIAVRASLLAKQYGIDYSTTDAMMDITATHANGCPLRLRELAAADQFNFGHDVFGIRRHINRTTGALENCFLPRYSK